MYHRPLDAAGPADPHVLHERLAQLSDRELADELEFAAASSFLREGHPVHGYLPEVLARLRGQAEPAHSYAVLRGRVDEARAARRNRGK